jgi:AcrR family transcriptional regulator
MSRKAETARVRGPQARGEITREKILDAVLELTALGGPRAVTYRAVAEKAGVAPGVMTYHFASHRELLAQAMRLHLQRLRANTIELPISEARALSTEAKTDLIFDFLKAMAGRDRMRYLAEFELMLELARDPELREEIAPETELTRAFAAELLEASGSPHPVEDAMLFSAVMEGLLLEWLPRPDDRAFARQIKAAIRRLVEVFFP